MSDLDHEAPGTDANAIDSTLGMEARMTQFRLPEEGEPLSEVQRAEIIETVQRHLKVHGVNQKELGQTIGYHSVTVSQVLSGKYKGAPDPVLRAMASYVEDDVKRRNQTAPAGFVETSVVLSVRALASYCKSNALSADQLERGAAMNGKPRIGIGFGPAGCGKSAVAEAYTMVDPRSILVRFIGSRGRAAHLAADIWSAMSASGARAPRAATDQIFRNLRGSQRLLIVDEGHRLGFSQCELLRDLSDVCGIPILILATQEFYERLSSVRRREGRFQYDQFTSRVGYVVDLLKGVDGKGGTRRPYYSLDEIAAMFRRDQVRISPDGLEYLQALACTVGGGMLRVCVAVFDKAYRSARKKAVAITLALLDSSVDRSMVPAGMSDKEFKERVMKTLAFNRQMNAGMERKIAAAG